MPAIIVTLKDGASSEELEKAKQQVKDQGGKITNELKLTKGFTAEFPNDTVHEMKTNEHVEVEEDSVVTTQ